MADHAFTVTYDGPALRDGHMPVRELAPALLALSDAVTTASRVLDPNAQPPGLAISATELGSFRVLLHVVEPSFVDRVTDLFTGVEVTATVNVAGLFTIVVGGFKVVRYLKGRRIRRVEQRTAPKPGEVKITFDDGTSITVNKLSLDLAKDLDFRKASSAVVSPLEQGIIDNVTIGDDGQSVSVDASDKDAFDVPDVQEELLLDTTVEAYLRLDTIAFGDNRKWKVTDGDATYWARITDLGFLDRVQRNVESFSAGDLMHVELHVKQWNSAQGVKVERTITRVISHQPGPKQVALPFVDEDDDA